MSKYLSSFFFVLSLEPYTFSSIPPSIKKMLRAHLRAHPSSVTCSSFFPYPISTSLNDSEQLSSSTSNPPDLAQFLATSDESGLIYIWSLTKRRPISIFQAHKGSIIKVEFIPLLQNKTETNSKNSSSLALDNNGVNGLQQLTNLYLLSHSRDNSIKIFDVFSIIKKSLELGLSRHEASTPLDFKPFNTPNLVYSLPVNTLNFCPVSISTSPLPTSTKTLSDGGNTNDNNSDNNSDDKNKETKKDTHELVLSVPSTMDSKNLDVYSISLPHTLKLTRLFQAIPPPPDDTIQPAFKKQTNSTGEDSPMSVLDNDGESGKDKTGILMSIKLIQVSETVRLLKEKEKPKTTESKEYVLVAGYESGHVVVYSLTIPLDMITEKEEQQQDTKGNTANNADTQNVLKENKKVINSNTSLNTTTRPRLEELDVEPLEFKKSSIPSTIPSNKKAGSSGLGSLLKSAPPQKTSPSPKQSSTSSTKSPSNKPICKILKVCFPHKQPVLSLSYRWKFDSDTTTAKIPSLLIYSSSADSKIIQHKFTFPQFSSTATTTTPLSDITYSWSFYQMPTPGTCSLAVRDDSAVLATAGWDGMVRIFSFLKPKKEIREDDDKKETKLIKEKEDLGPFLKPLAAFRGGRSNGDITGVSFGPVASKPVFFAPSSFSSSSGDDGVESNNNSTRKLVLSHRLGRANKLGLCNNSHYNGLRKTTSLANTVAISNASNLSTQLAQKAQIADAFPHYMAVAGKDGRIGLYEVY